ncbi:MAG: hypothetical protein IS860_10650 [Nitrosopumilus sp.]|nr:hypothetical protein [Nitrosopumilus sp.]
MSAEQTKPSDATSDFSLSDNVRSFIQQAYDNNIDLKIESNRKDMIKQFKEAFPNENPKTISTLFSNEIPKVSKAYGISPDDVKQKPSEKFSSKLKSKTKPKEQKSNIKTVGISNPNIVGKDGKPVIVRAGTQQTQYKYKIKSSQLSSFSNAMYGMFQVFSEDLEDLTESESQDLGDLWQPVTQAKLGNSDRGQAALAVGGTFGIMARKAKKAKQNRKVRKEKESKEKGQSLEPTPAKESESASSFTIESKRMF